MILETREQVQRLDSIYWLLCQGATLETIIMDRLISRSSSTGVG